MIKLQVIGHLGKDCRQNEVNGKNVINFSVAHSEKFKNSTGTMQEKTTWVECAYWTDRTGIAPYLVKGQLVYVEGSPDVESYKKQDGEPGASLKLRVREVQLLGGKADAQRTDDIPGGQYKSAPAPSAPAPVAHEESADDLPF